MLMNMGKFSAGPSSSSRTDARAQRGEADGARLVQPEEMIAWGGSNSSPPAGENLIKKTL